MKEFATILRQLTEVVIEEAQKNEAFRRRIEEVLGCEEQDRQALKAQVEITEGQQMPAGQWIPAGQQAPGEEQVQSRQQVQPGITGQLRSKEVVSGHAAESTALDFSNADEKTLDVQAAYRQLGEKELQKLLLAYDPGQINYLLSRYNVKKGNASKKETLIKKLVEKVKKDCADGLTESADEAEKTGSAARAAEAKVIEDGAKAVETAKEAAAAKQAAPPKTSKSKRNPAAFSPITVYLEGGNELLKTRLAELDIEQLKDIIYEYSLDTTQKYKKWKDVDKLTDLILRRAEQKATRGDVFRVFTSHEGNPYT